MKFLRKIPAEHVSCCHHTHASREIPIEISDGVIGCLDLSIKKEYAAAREAAKTWLKSMVYQNMEKSCLFLVKATKKFENYVKLQEIRSLSCGRFVPKSPRQQAPCRAGSTKECILGASELVKFCASSLAILTNSCAKSIDSCTRNIRFL